jgi:hypothetical protein
VADQADRPASALAYGTGDSLRSPERSLPAQSCCADNNRRDDLLAVIADDYNYGGEA